MLWGKGGGGLVVISCWDKHLLIPPNLHLFSTYNSPSTVPYLNNMFGSKNTLPRIGTSCACICAKNVYILEEPVLKTLKTRLCLFCINLQTCMANRASLNFLRFLKLIPPLYLGLHGWTQFAQWVFFLCSSLPFKTFLAFSLSLCTK